MPSALPSIGRFLCMVACTCNGCKVLRCRHCNRLVTPYGESHVHVQLFLPSLASRCLLLSAVRIGTVVQLTVTASVAPCSAYSSCGEYTMKAQPRWYHFRAKLKTESHQGTTSSRVSARSLTRQAALLCTLSDLYSFR